MGWEKGGAAVAEVAGRDDDEGREYGFSPHLPFGSNATHVRVVPIYH